MRFDMPSALCVDTKILRLIERILKVDSLDQNSGAPGGGST